MIPDLMDRSWGFQAQTQAFCRRRPSAIKMVPRSNDGRASFDDNADAYRPNHLDNAASAQFESAQRIEIQY
jgi:hypothetical protein